MQKRKNKYVSPPFDAMIKEEVTLEATKLVAVKKIRTLINNSINRRNDIQALFVEINSGYDEIEKLYNLSLNKREIDPSLQVKIKSYLEHARSILDYCAQDIAGALEIKSEKIYFPIVESHKNLNSFEGFIGRHLPGLKAKDKALFDNLEKIQPYHQDYDWLGHLVVITNENKHDCLTPQGKHEIPSLTLESNAAVIQISGDSSIALGEGCMVQLGNAKIQGNQVISAFSSQIISDPQIKVKRQIWVDFKFYDEISVLGLLAKIKDELPSIISEIYKKLDK